MKHRLSNSKTFPILCCLALGLIITGCAEKISSEEAVKMRATERWAIRTAGKIDGLYEFLTPSKRQIMGRVSYERSFGGTLRYLKSDVQEVICSDLDTSVVETCEVKVYVEYESMARIRTQSKRTISETWIKEDDQWWFLPK